jgi:Protein of unknown function (DUF3592)
MEVLDWIVRLLPISILIWWWLAQGRHAWRRFCSRRWPAATATIQKGSIGPISFGRGVTVSAVFLGYGFLAQGVRRAGIFAVYGTQDEDILRGLEERLAGASVEVRYDPSDLGVSYLVDIHDSRFEGLTVTQNPKWLSQAPEFHIGDVIR